MDATVSVLIIDDDQVDRLVVRELLQERFYVQEAYNEQTARTSVSVRPPDCVLLDYLIPGVDSLALLSELSTQNFPVIILTGEGNEAIAVKAMKNGAQDYISKNTLSGELLIRTINNAIATVELKRKLAEKQQELIAANDQLKSKVEELEALTNDLENFIHITAHDLREPLRTLCSYCDLLELTVGNEISERAAEYLDSIRTSSKRLAALIDDLRALTKVVYTELDFTLIELPEVVHEVLSRLADLITQKHVRIIENTLPRVHAVRPLVIELYVNLVNNALKYGPDSSEIEFTAALEDNVLVFGVRNSGSIIPADKLEKIFQPFFRLDNEASKDGTGMGLALCRKIVERHHGKIWAESSAERGTHFRFTFGSGGEHVRIDRH
jgi:signal transduction histidine kinase